MTSTEVSAAVGTRARIVLWHAEGPGLSHWSSRSMADYVTRTSRTPVSHHWVANLWREHGLKPR